MRYIIGIDPGLKGACAVIDAYTNSVVDVFDMPTKAAGANAKKGSRVICFDSLKYMLQPFRGKAYAITEAAIVKPPMTYVAAKTIGYNYSTIHSALLSNLIDFDEVSPSTWKKTLGISSDKDEATLHALANYPDAAFFIKRHDHAEAILIAHYLIATDQK